MKLQDLFENIVNVDFAKARAIRDARAIHKNSEQKLSQDYEKLVDEDERETTSVYELAKFEEWMHAAKKKGRVPGFADIDEVQHYLVADLEFPSHITRAKAIQWFSALSEEERERARMIAHHADRIIQIYEILRTKLHGLQDTWVKRFEGNAPKDSDAITGGDWLNQEFNQDIKTMKNLKKAIVILGQ